MYLFVVNNTWIVQPQFNADSIALFPRPGFEPSMISEVAAGYWWDASAAVGLGTTAFKIPEGSGKSSFDLVQATVANQPTQLTENSRTQWRMRKSTDSNPSTVATTGNVRAGWTGATYVAGWFRLPDANGDITGNCGLLIHTLGTGNQRRVFFNAIATGDSLNFTLSSDGTAGNTGVLRTAATFSGSPWRWIEAVFDPSFLLGGSTIADKMKLFSNLTQLNATTAPSFDVTTLFDALAPLVVGCNTVNGVHTGPIDTIDFGGVIVYANGIPDLGNRRQLAMHKAPTAITF